MAHPHTSPLDTPNEYSIPQTSGSSLNRSKLSAPTAKPLSNELANAEDPANGSLDS